MGNAPELQLVSMEEGEVGEEIVIEGAPAGVIKATWLGVVGENGWTLADAMRLMAEIAKEREAQDEQG